jgi:hypothetical protein
MLGVLFAVVRHAGWWLEWQTSASRAAGARDLAEVELQPADAS